jgi:hypothetical protein
LDCLARLRNATCDFDPGGPRHLAGGGKANFPGEAIIPFNFGCYFCQLGDLETAQDRLMRAFAIDSNWRVAALDDQDLEPLWDFLNQG